MNRKKLVFLVLVIVVVAIQFIKTEVATASFKPEDDFINITQADEHIATILKTSCYDCHSEEYNQPWYASVAPISWWINDHVNEGKKHLNFSAFGTYSAKKAAHKLEECYEEVEKDEMPLSSYTIVHSNALLSEEDKLTLINWFKTLEKQYKNETE